MGEGREKAQVARVGHQDVKLAEAVVKRGAQPIQAVAVLDVEGDQGGVDAGSIEYRVIQLLQPALGASGGDDVCSGLRQP